MSVQTTERCLGCKQRIQSAVNDTISIEAPASNWGFKSLRFADHPPNNLQYYFPASNSLDGFACWEKSLGARKVNKPLRTPSVTNTSPAFGSMALPAGCTNSYPDL
jgi:hypothetical protein